MHFIHLFVRTYKSSRIITVFNHNAFARVRKNFKMTITPDEGWSNKSLRLVACWQALVQRPSKRWATGLPTRLHPLTGNPTPNLYVVIDITMSLDYNSIITLLPLIFYLGFKNLELQSLWQNIWKPEDKASLQMVWEMCLSLLLDEQKARARERLGRGAREGLRRLFCKSFRRWDLKILITKLRGKNIKIKSSMPCDRLNF